MSSPSISSINSINPINPIHSPALNPRLLAAVRIGAAALVGFGLMLWIAANWADFGKWARFAIVGGTVALSALAAIAQRAARVPGLLVAVCASGGLLALFGQTYQTGADPWTLFAVWSLLALPWVIAARHDAVWSAWIIVAFTALGLWVAQADARWVEPAFRSAASAWLIGGALALGMSPFARLEGWIGRTRWALRLATLSLAMLILVYAVPAVFSDRAGVYLLGLAIVAIGVWMLAAARPLDLPLLAIAALALDVLIIAGLWRLIVERLHAANAGNMLFAGLLSAGVVALSAMALLRVARSAAADSEADSDAGPDTATPAAASRWPIAVLSGFGALLAAIPIWIFYGLTFTTLLRSAAGAFTLGLVTIAGALALLYRADRLGFRAQFGFIALLTGLGVAGYGCFDGLAFEIASLAMAALVTILAFVVQAPWIRGLLGAAAAGFVAAGIATMGEPRALLRAESALAAPAWIAIAGTVGLAIWHRAAEGRVYEKSAAYLFGWSAAAIAGLIAVSGSTFMFGAGIIPAGAATIGQAAQFKTISLRAVLSLGCALIACVIVLSRRGEFRNSLGYGVATAALALAWLASSLGPILLLGAMALRAGLRPILMFALIGTVWCVGALYYQLEITLATKALILIAIGAAIGALSLRHRGPVAGSIAPASGGWRPVTAMTLIGLGLVATAGSVGYSIVDKEAIIRNGQRIYVRLAPVDPRSVMQGDYMALRFELPDRGRMDTGQARMQAVATLDPTGVAKVARIVPAPAALSNGEIAIDLKHKHGAWMIATDAWYFKEGTGKRFEAARYGEFRLLGDGRVLLVGMADERLAAIR